ncbi:MAG TPA: glycosyltransferase family 2 protein, partial [Anaeromyxobacteraceae bacterium]|nr:glycosyltransferase family 2 protein [Anaeromyxobacteraceae bacterium]
ARRRAARLAPRPLVSLVCPVGEREVEAVAATLASLRAQVYGEWELLLVEDGGRGGRAAAPPGVEAERDPRVRLVAAPGAEGPAAVARGIDAARGACLALLEPGAHLEPDAVFLLARAFAGAADLDVAYTDEDRLGADGRRRDPVFKPAWSPNLLLSTNYPGRLCAVRRGLAGGSADFTPGCDGAEAYDLVLRAAERARRIERVPEVLYHGPPGRRPATEGGRRALQAALARRDVDGLVGAVGPGRYRVRYPLAGAPLVSIVIPSRDRAALLRACVASILDRSSYRGFEIVVADNGSREPGTLDYLRSIPPPHRALACPGEFNWSAINNLAAREARGEHLLFLNDDVEVLAPDWLEALLEHSQRPGVGAVGARLLYPDGAVQHAGVVLGAEGFAGHPFRGLKPGAAGYDFLASAVRDCSAVTGACMMVPRAAFRESGGFDERLRQAFNDVDFCLRLRGRGYSVVYTPHAVLRHVESATRTGPVPRSEVLLARRRWGALAAGADSYDMADLSSAS